MARVQYGVIVTELKGKVQGSVFQRGNVGYVLRNKGYKKGTASLARSNASAVQTANVTTWRTLTPAERLLWDAIKPDWLFYNKFGASYQGTAFQIFVAYNNLLVHAGEPVVSVPVVPIAPADPGIRSISWSLAVGLVIVWINAGGVDDLIFCYGQAPVSAGRNTNNPRLISLLNASIFGATSIDITSDYTIIFGIPEIGQQVVIKAIWRNKTYPYTYYPITLSAIVTA